MWLKCVRHPKNVIFTQTLAINATPISYSLSSLHSVLNLKYDHPVLVQILELYTEMTREGREIVFIWVPGHAGIWRNSAADSAAKDALDALG